MPPRGVGRDHRFFTQGDKRHRCVCGVGSTASKAHRRPKNHSSPEVPRIVHSCYTWIGVDKPRRSFIVLLVWRVSQSAAAIRRIKHQSTLLEEGAQYGQTAEGLKGAPSDGFRVH